MNYVRKRAKIAGNIFSVLGYINIFILIIILFALISTKDFSSIPMVLIVLGGIIFALFSLSYILKNKPEKIIPALNNTNDNDETYASYYKAEWFYKDVYSEYCKKHNVEKVTTQAEVTRIWEYTFNKLSVFLTWLIDRDFFIFEDEEIQEGAEKLKTRKITANEFFVVSCAMSFSKSEIKKSAIDFVNDYFYFGIHKYGNYEEDYNYFIKNKLNKDVNEIIFSWDEYEQFKQILNKAYDNYTKGINEEKKQSEYKSTNAVETYNIEFPFCVYVYKTKCDDENEPLELKGVEAYNFLNNKDIETVSINFKNSNLYKYFNGVNKKIVNMEMKFLENGYINVTVSVREILSDEEKQILLKELSGQLSDGWGEGEFEFRKDSGEIYEIVFWKYQDWNINYI